MRPDIFWLVLDKLVADPVATFYTIFFGTWVSEDGAMVTSALLWHAGKIDGNIVFWANSVGVSCGDLILYYIGYQISFGLERPWLQRFIKPQAVEKGRRFFAKWGNWLTFVARFVPGLRVPAFTAAGLLRSPFAPFGAVVFLTAFFFVGLQMMLINAAGDHINPEGIFLIFLVVLLMTRWVLRGFEDQGWARRWNATKRVLSWRIVVKIQKPGSSNGNTPQAPSEAPKAEN